MNQSERHRLWIEREGGVEHPTRMETLLKPEQQARIDWLREHVEGSVLDVGCNWGYVAWRLGASCAVDINRENVSLGKEAFDIDFCVADALHLPFREKSFDTVVLADVLEHLPEVFEGVPMALVQAERVARKKLLITLPWKQVDDCALCFKHKWVPDSRTVGNLLTWLMQTNKKVVVECDMNFVYIEVWVG